MRKTKEFILEVLKVEAEAWNIKNTPDLHLINTKVDELYSYATTDMANCFGIYKQTSLKSESYYMKSIEPMSPRHLFKLSSYKNDVYNNIWVAYVSYKNADIEEKLDPYGAAFIISEIDCELKIIGSMNVDIDELTMEPTHWVKSMCNPSDLDISNLGEFTAVERYREPKDDGFSMEDYLEDAMTPDGEMRPLSDLTFLLEDAIAGIECIAVDNKTNREVIEKLSQKGVDCKIDWR